MDQEADASLFGKPEFADVKIYFGHEPNEYMPAHSVTLTRKNSYLRRLFLQQFYQGEPMSMQFGKQDEQAVFRTLEWIYTGEYGRRDYGGKWRTNGSIRLHYKIAEVANRMEFGTLKELALSRFEAEIDFESSENIREALSMLYNGISIDGAKEGLVKSCGKLIGGRTPQSDKVRGAAALHFALYPEFANDLVKFLGDHFTDDEGIAGDGDARNIDPEDVNLGDVDPGDVNPAGAIPADVILEAVSSGGFNARDINPGNIKSRDPSPQNIGERRLKMECSSPNGISEGDTNASDVTMRDARSISGRLRPRYQGSQSSYVESDESCGSDDSDESYEDVS